MGDENLTRYFRESLARTETEINELAKQRRIVDDKESCLADWKRYDNDYLIWLHNDLQGDDSSGDKRIVGNMIDDSQTICQRLGCNYAQEREDITQGLKRLAEQREALQRDCRRAMAEEKRGMA